MTQRPVPGTRMALIWFATKTFGSRWEWLYCEHLLPDLLQRLIKLSALPSPGSVFAKLQWTSNWYFSKTHSTSFSLNQSALTQGCNHPFRTRNAARTPRTHQSVLDHGVSCLRNNFVSRKVRKQCPPIESTSREGPHAKYHYMIAGVQGIWSNHFLRPLLTYLGDFIKSIVNNPPKTLWTRQLKV